ncbi:hypothetical protein EB820_03045 [Brevibacillus agri]|uniref:Uncharacterized protein n=1 Tax=Brevibacillus agri TaxID=51101 RepID=A0A3M8BBV9_9BACL|nr:hypothetical protein D478_15215 [Brevibacillus agri BAB-2500]MBG9565257.1 hypothetical protein [Brevibacillus agri]QAV11430.1 hypothetical protein BA6348_00625 [Brevibacillus agri]RNB60517.1 hypothetical protein EB820_03045 [Brevibacillus agri]
MKYSARLRLDAAKALTSIKNAQSVPKSEKQDINNRLCQTYNETRNQQLQIRPNPEALGNGGPNLLGLIPRFRGRDERLFRHPTRQLTSSAKAREVKRPPV